MKVEVKSAIRYVFATSALLLASWGHLQADVGPSVAADTQVDDGESTSTDILASEVDTVLRLPQLGDEGGISYAQERIIGEEIAREFATDPNRIDDPLLTEYVDGIWRRLISVAQQNGYVHSAMADRFVWRSYLLRDPTVNAFVTPGGVMGVHLGLIGAVDSSDELASVLAHETSHVSQRHISRLVDKKKRQTPLQIATFLITAVAASKGDGQVAQAAMAGGQALALQQQINFTRGMEQEADRVGYLIAKGAGFDANGFVSMFEKLQQANRLNDDGAFPYLRSHPLTKQRIGDMRARVGLQNGLNRRGEGPVAGQLDSHSLIQARAQVLSKKDVTHWQQAFQEKPATSAQRVIQAYKALLAAVLLNDKQLIHQYAQVLASQKLSNISSQDAIAVKRQIDLLLAEADLKLEKPDAALKKLEGTYTLTPRPETFLLARAWMQSQKPKRAIAILQSWLSAYPQDVQAHTLLASAYEMQGKLLRAVGEKAKAHAADYNYAQAADTLRAGQALFTSGLDKDLIEAQVIDAALQKMLRLRKMQEDNLEALKIQ